MRPPEARRGGWRRAPSSSPLACLRSCFFCCAPPGTAAAANKALPRGFDIDDSVSVFEINIRLLGGLLAGHQLAVDPVLGIYGRPGGHEQGAEKGGAAAAHHQRPDEDGNDSDDGGVGGGDGAPYYDGSLLRLAVDLGERLLPAFETPTGIPFGTVNLRRGVPKGETPISSLAGAGSLSLELTVLSDLSGRPEFGARGQGAALALLGRATELGLHGKHVNVRSGKWSESVAGIGSNADSFYEYLLKMYLLFGGDEWWRAFVGALGGVNAHMVHGDWFADVREETKDTGLTAC